MLVMISVEVTITPEKTVKLPQKQVFESKWIRPGKNKIFLYFNV